MELLSDPRNADFSSGVAKWSKKREIYWLPKRSLEKDRYGIILYIFIEKLFTLVFPATYHYLHQGCLTRFILWAEI